MSTELPIEDEARGKGTRPAPLRAALAASLVLHAVGMLWLLDRNEAQERERGMPSFEVTLMRAAPPPAVEARPDPPTRSRPEPEVPASADAPPEPEQEEPRSARPRAAAAVSPGTTAPAPLDLSLPADVIRPAPESAPGIGVFDPALARRIDAARSARRAPAAAAGPRTWTRGAGDRTRIETERGCYERVRDPFDDRPGDQWWFVECSGEAEIDWGRRFRSRP